MTGSIDLTNHALTNQVPVLPEYSVAVYLLNDPDKLMSQDTLEAHIATRNLQVSIANPHLYNTDQCLTSNRCGMWIIMFKCQPSASVH